MRSLLFLTVCLVLPAAAQPAKPPAEADAARKAAQAFYDWYAPMAMKSSKEPAFERALRERSAALSEDLAKALAADAAAQRAVPDDIVGLDWDPFLNAQDSYPRYQTGTVTAKEGAFLVAMHGVVSGKRIGEAVFVVEMVPKGGRYLLANVRGAKGGDLMTSLRQLAEERRKTGKK
ncbi:MAG: hypothetical protein U0P81_12905 [Holophagaceae bacterium]